MSINLVWNAKNTWIHFDVVVKADKLVNSLPKITPTQIYFYILYKNYFY